METGAPPTVAVIGGGPAGLATARHMLAAGLQPTVFEQASQIGGLWSAAPPRRWSADSLQANVSRWCMSFSDCSWPAGSPDFPSRAQVRAYLQQYAAQHELMQHVQFNCTVLHVNPVSQAPHGSTQQQQQEEGEGEKPAGTQRWLVRWVTRAQQQPEPVGPGTGGSSDRSVQQPPQAALQRQQQQQQQAEFDHVVLASGFFSAPRLPDLPGLSAATAAGLAIHAAAYHKPDAYAGKRVVVVGASVSGAEIAADVAPHAASVVHVVSHPFWVLRRYLPVDPSSAAPTFMPLDLVLFRRSTRSTPHERVFRTEQECEMQAKFLAAVLGDQQQLLCPELSMSGQQAAPAWGCISDTYAGHVRSGRITVKLSRVVSLEGGKVRLASASSSAGARPGQPPANTEHTALDAPGDQASPPHAPHSSKRTDSSAGHGHGSGHGTHDDSAVLDADAVIFCTGYQANLPYLAPDLLHMHLGYDPSDTLCPLLLHRNVWHPALPGAACVGMYRGAYFAVMELQARWASAVFSGRLPTPPEAVQRDGIALEEAVRRQQPRPQFPHGDYVGMADDLASEMGVLPPSDVLRECDNVLAAQYRWQDSPAVAEAAVSELAQARAAYRAGRMVARMVFKALHGNWRFERTIDSRLAGSPSGTVTGTASFRPTSKPNELLYHEEGEFIMSPAAAGSLTPAATPPSVQRMRTWREYYYRYDEAADRIDVYFSNAGSVMGGLFHSLRFLPPVEAAPAVAAAGHSSSSPAGRSQGAGDAAAAHAGQQPTTGAGNVPAAAGAPTARATLESGGSRAAIPPGPGWRAVGEQHLCGRDLYDTAYRFEFRGVNLAAFDVVYEVQGPAKDYTSSASYHWQGGPAPPV